MVGIENRRTAAGHHDGRVTSGTSAVLRLRGGPVGNFARAASKLVAVVGSRRHGLRHDRGGQPSGRDAFDGSDPPSGDGGV